MIKPLFNYGISDEQFATIGRIIVECAHVDFQIDTILSNMWEREGAVPADPPREIGRKVGELKRLVRQGLAPEIADLTLELRHALAIALRARNLMAHGILLIAADDSLSFWSQGRQTEMPIDQAFAAERWASYATHCATHITWTLLQIEPPTPLPDRPT